ncbi:MAG: hypothetical protein ACJ8FU_18880 [Xanthobacteraceae bacterium]|jgi:hypothetical protein
MTTRLVSLAAILAIFIAAGHGAAAEPMTADEFRHDLVGVPLCGTPDYGPFAGKMLCTVHLPDGTAVVAGQGMLVRGTWEVEAGRVCRRNAQDPLDRRRCIDYEKVGQDRYRNSDGIDLCIGPCP